MKQVPKPNIRIDKKTPEVENRIIALRDLYKESTRSLCALAGVTVVDKLEDVDFLDVRSSAMQADSAQTTILMDNISYALFQLYRLDGDNAWFNI